MSPIFIMMQGGVDVQHPFDVVGYGIVAMKIHKNPQNPRFLEVFFGFYRSLG